MWVRGISFRCGVLRKHLRSADRPEGPGYGSRSGTELTTKTSWTQGRVYAMVPEAERVDQPDVQGMLLFLHVLIGALCLLLLHLV